MPQGMPAVLIPASAQRGASSGSRPISRVLSWTVIHLDAASPQASSNLPGNRTGRTIVPLFGLAPGGVYPATPVTRRAVRSYRTISPLPAAPCGSTTGGIFSVALSMGSRPPGVTWHLALWSPDFPPRLRGATVWPTPGQSIEHEHSRHTRFAAVIAPLPPGVCPQL